MERDAEKASIHGEGSTDSSPQTALDSPRASLGRTRSQNGYGVDNEQPALATKNAPAGGAKDEDPFEVGWDDGDKDPLCPRSFGKARKWLITFILCFGSFTVTNTSSIYTSTYEQMEAEFHNARIISTLGLSTFVLGISLGPMMLGPMSEFYGRRPIYLVTWLMFLIWLIPSAAAPNIATIVVTRFFCGFAGSAFLAVSGGTVGDLFARHELQAPMAMYTAAPFFGPTMGPLVGGFINYNINWRWTYYVLIITSFVLYIAIIFFVPETYHPILLRNKARERRKATGDDRWKAPTEKVSKSVLKALSMSLMRPFELLFFEPMCLNLCILSALLLGILYLFFGAFPAVFGNVYGFNLWQIGLSFVGIGVGMLIGISSDPVWQRVRTGLVQKLEQETGIPGASEPEFRLPPAILGAVCAPVGLFIFAWTCFPWVHWIAPMIGTVVFGVG
ncbi:hypothetical protein VHEMI06854 [[Torrubiella] hemipterigena]|nr:hypothetical protein VHEMI06854 [[Torrubiella] hemipterigena]